MESSVSPEVQTLWCIDPVVVEHLRARLSTGSTSDLPDNQVLSELLRVAANASLLQEEGRPTTFALLLAADLTPSSEGFFSLEEALPYSPETIRRLAQVLGGPFDFLVVAGPTAYELKVTGVLHVQQPHEPNCRNIRTGLFVVARGPGHLSVGERGEEVLRISPQGLAWPARAVSADNLLLLELDKALHRPKQDLCSRESVVLLRLGRALLSHGHGGALFVMAGDASNQSFTVKYKVEPASVCLSQALAAAWDDDADGAVDLPLPAFEWQRREYARNRLPEAIATVARLSAVDGAVLLGADLSLRGFGTFVAIGEGDSPILATEFRIGGTGVLEKVRQLPAGKTGGARHQSAVKFVASHRGQSVAFVASQDGMLTLLFGCEDGTVCMIRPIGPAALTR